MRMMKNLLILILITSLYGCVSGAERKVDAACSFLYFLPLPMMSLIFGNAGCILAADQAAVADEEDDEDED